jgi:predicted DNA-binding antitoxin AbrB/MazE fold protein
VIETVTAVYENGLLRPMGPLSLKEGETVQLTVLKPASRPSDEELIAMMKAAKSPEELFAIANAYPTAPPGYDLCESLEENRRREGALPLFPPEMKGKTW